MARPGRSSKKHQKHVRSNPAPLSYTEKLARLRTVKLIPFRARVHFKTWQKSWITRQYARLSSKIKYRRRKLRTVPVVHVIPYDYELFLQQQEILREIRIEDERAVQEALERLAQIPPHLRDIEGAREQREILRELHQLERIESLEPEEPVEPESYRETYDYKDARYYVFNWFDYDELYQNLVDLYRAYPDTPVRIMFYFEDKRSGDVEQKSTSWNYNLRFDGPDDVMHQLHDEIKRWDSSPEYGRVLWDYEIKLVWIRH